MKGIKTTIYLSDEVRRTAKKHIIDTGETLSAFIEAAIKLKLEHDKSRSGRKKLLARQKTVAIDKIIEDLEKA